MLYKTIIKAQKFIVVFTMKIHYLQVHLNKLECHGKVNLFQ